jgi:hypothetical protein
VTVVASSDRTHELVNDLLVSGAEVYRRVERTHVSLCLCVLAF